MDDVTGSISKQIEAADAAPRADGRADGSGHGGGHRRVMPVAPPPSGRRTRRLPRHNLPTRRAAAAAAGQYGVDIGSGLTIASVARALGGACAPRIRQLFEGLQPIVTRQGRSPRANRVELRLVVGPLADAGAATQLCASLTPFGLFCQPTIFDGQHLALR